MPELFRSRYFVWFLIVAFSMFALSVRTARADFGDLAQFFISTVFSFVLSFVLIGIITFFCLPCGAGIVGAIDTVAATLNALFAATFFTATNVSLITTVLTSAVGTALCIGGPFFLGQCAPQQSPDIYYIGTTPLSLKFPPPTIVASSTSPGPGCSINLSWSVLNITHYGIYRATGDSTSTLIYKSDVCIPRNGTSTPFVINYTDAGLQPATTYTYNLAVEDINGQLFKFPNQVVNTSSTCQ